MNIKRVLGVLVLGSCVVHPNFAAAQERRAPHTGSTAVGVDVGAFVPRDGELEAAPVVNALLEFSGARCTSVRGPGSTTSRRAPASAPTSA